MQIKTLHDRPYVTLDSVDRKIIDLLNDNARMSYTDIGKEVGLTRVAVQLRLQSLVDNGVIESFTLAVNPEPAGFYLTAFFEISVEPRELEKLAEEIMDHPPVTLLYQLSGPSKLHMYGQFIDQVEMEGYLKTKLYVLPGITNVDFQIVIHMYKNRMALRPLGDAVRLYQP
ncbi:DNA-binding transcriptional regulator, Lrp family [Cohnella sp. OV330]|uniref:Lrp/AsnC family transcriptional regulator n=1 Tax=Cohnella sp. OV330 TaxID=1855288 RepID=UPI0008EEBBD2|nr:Lrp/AsnC family transcriptional regulator [Cohnella sp. OV330]SFB09630.1 DNA-binding transcriptional regulator, Lrp family [Cohnella sp. OV330]